MLVIDTSAVVKFFCKEEGWEGVKAYFADGMTMSFALSELGNALLVKVLNHHFGFTEASEILSKYAKAASLLNDEEYVETAFRIAHSNRLTMYDSLFVAACIDEGFGLVTCDVKQAMEARNLGVSVIEC